MIVWRADKNVLELVEDVKKKHHLPRLAEARVALCFNDSKPFVKGRFNWGKVQKFSNVAKLWHAQDECYDFLINLCGEAWIGVLDNAQREAWVDLCLTRCDVEYEPVMVEENGKKKPVKDEWGRVQYTEVMKRDENDIPRWKTLPLDINVYQDNVVRYGCWCPDLNDLKSAVLQGDNK